jgi:hypothetical protein
MERDGGRATISMTELFVGSALAGLRKAEPFEKLGDLASFEDGKRTQGLSYEDRMGANEINFQAWLPVLEKQLDHLAEVRLQLIEALGLGMGARPTGDMTNIQAGFGIALDDGGKATHMLARCGTGT